MYCIDHFLDNNAHVFINFMSMTVALFFMYTSEEVESYIYDVI
jgi:hypothetical protein